MVVPSDYTEQVVQLRKQLAALQAELQAADQAGDRRRGLEILAHMLKLQRAFFSRWQVTPRPEGRDDGARGPEGGGNR